LEPRKRLLLFPGVEHFVYILESEKDHSYYIGSTHDLRLRLVHHNDGWTRSTKAKRPWRIAYMERFASKSDALKRERAIKRMKSRRYIESLIAGKARGVA
jgi:putative endonuclease